MEAVNPPGQQLLGRQPLIVSMGDKTGDSLPGDQGGQVGGQVKPGGCGGVNRGKGTQLSHQAIQTTGAWPVLYLIYRETQMYLSIFLFFFWGGGEKYFTTTPYFFHSQIQTEMTWLPSTASDIQRHKIYLSILLRGGGFPLHGFFFQLSNTQNPQCTGTLCIFPLLKNLVSL